MKNFHLFTIENFSCISNSKYSAINRIFLLLNWSNTLLKNRPVKVYDARYTLNLRFWGYFPFFTKELQILVFPNFPQNTNIQCLIGTFNIWIKLSDTGVNLMHRSIRCIMIIFQWLRFIFKIRCNYDHLTTHLCFQGSQLRTKHWIAHSQEILWTIMGCSNTNGRCC